MLPNSDTTSKTLTTTVPFTRFAATKPGESAILTHQHVANKAGTYSTLAYGRLDGDFSYSERLGSAGELNSLDTIYTGVSSVDGEAAQKKYDSRDKGRKITRDIDKHRIIERTPPATKDEIGAATGLDSFDVENDSKYPDFIPFKIYDIQNDTWIILRATVTGINDSISPDWSPVKYPGRAEPVYVYSGAERELSFEFTTVAHHPSQLRVMWQKLNHLIGLGYPTYNSASRMVAPFIKLTLGDWLRDVPGFLSTITVIADDDSPWEINIERDVNLSKLPHVVNVSVGFTVIGKVLPSSLSKHIDYGYEYKGQTLDFLKPITEKKIPDFPDFKDIPRDPKEFGKPKRLRTLGSKKLGFKL